MWHLMQTDDILAHAPEQVVEHLAGGTDRATGGNSSSHMPGMPGISGMPGMSGYARWLDVSRCASTEEGHAMRVRVYRVQQQYPVDASADRREDIHPDDETVWSEHPKDVDDSRLQAVADLEVASLEQHLR